MEKVDDRDVVRLLAGARVAIGVVFVFAPKRAARLWTGEQRPSVTATMAARGLGARDLALGLGALLALEHDTPVRGWLEAGAVADATDAFSALSSWRSLPKLRRLMLLASGTSAAILGVKLAGDLE